MKKLLPLLALALSANAQQNYPDQGKEYYGAFVENLVPYKHPGAKKVGYEMPLAIGKFTYEMDMYSSRVTKEIKGPGQTTCYGKDRDRESIGAVKDAGPITDDKDKEEIIFGLITGYDRNSEDGKMIAEYEVVRRKCDIDGELKNYSGYLLAKQYGIPYAVQDIPHRILYVDSSKNGYIDKVVECDVYSLESAVLHMPICKQKSD